MPGAAARELSGNERALPVAPLPPELADRAQADRRDVEERQARIRAIRREIANEQRAARAVGDHERQERLAAFARAFEVAARRTGSLDRFV
jgi:hypothetical protein